LLGRPLRVYRALSSAAAAAAAAAAKTSAALQARVNHLARRRQRCRREPSCTAGQSFLEVAMNGRSMNCVRLSRPINCPPSAELALQWRVPRGGGGGTPTCPNPRRPPPASAGCSVAAAGQ